MRFMDSVITGLNLRNCYGRFKKTDHATQMIQAIFCWYNRRIAQAWNIYRLIFLSSVTTSCNVSQVPCCVMSKLLGT